MLVIYRNCIAQVTPGGLLRTPAQHQIAGSSALTKRRALAVWPSRGPRPSQLRRVLLPEHTPCSPPFAGTPLLHAQGSHRAPHRPLGRRDWGALQLQLGSRANNWRMSVTLRNTVLENGVLLVSIDRRPIACPFCCCLLCSQTDISPSDSSLPHKVDRRLVPNGNEFTACRKPAFRPDFPFFSCDCGRRSAGRAGILFGTAQVQETGKQTCGRPLAFVTLTLVGGFSK